ncbi:beta-ketoacyl-ACP synthase II, partial [Alphaproteobacteria bacterium]|nr:beta-ketoacyl-ACP synthase II [Alphaproteobacteria bacterium]
MKRVVITGLGLLTSIGNNTEDTWVNLINLKSGIKKITHFDTDGLTCKIAGHISHDENDQFYYDRSIHLDVKDIKRNDRFIQYGIAAAKMAVEDSGLSDLNENKKLKVGVSVGSGIGGLETIYDGALTVANKGPRKLSPFFIPSSLVNLLSGQISIKYGFKGPNHSVVTACATGAHSIGDAGEMIKRGAANAMVAGGAEAAVCRLGVSGFCAARSLSTSFNDDPGKASRPWDKNRDGFVMGEGAGVLVLEEMEHAKKRGAKIYGELIGYGMSGDAYHITAPAEDGDGGYRAMIEAIKMAKLSPDDVQYVNAHGTSTMLGDKIELNAIKRLFKNNKNLHVSSTKSSIGHLLGAAGSVEAIFSLLSINNNILPATLNLDNPIDSENIKLIAKEPLKKETNLALSNS